MIDPPVLPAIDLPPPLALPEQMTINLPEVVNLKFHPQHHYLIEPPMGQAADMPQPLESEEEAEPREEGARATAAKSDRPAKAVRNLPAIPRLPEMPVASPVETPSIQAPLTSPETTTAVILGREVSLPRAEILTTAATTATVASVGSVAGTLAAGALFKRLTKLFKPVITFALKRVAKIRGREAPLTFARQRLKQRRSRLARREIQASP